MTNEKDHIQILKAIEESEKELLIGQERIIKGIDDNDKTHDKIVNNVKKLIEYNEIRWNNMQTWMLVINILGAVFGIILYWFSNYEEIRHGFSLWLK